jgi:heme-degrading monooxygenase HmoA
MPNNVKVLSIWEDAAARSEYSRRREAEALHAALRTISFPPGTTRGIAPFSLRVASPGRKSTSARDAALGCGAERILIRVGGTR